MITITLTILAMLTAGLVATKYQNQMFDISSQHFRFQELIQRRKMAIVSMVFFASVAFTLSFVNIFQGSTYG